MAKRNLTCACCGGQAGRFQQCPNQDTGFGICRKCIEWMLREKRETPEYIRETYGVEGVNYALHGNGLTLAQFTNAAIDYAVSHYEFMRQWQPELFKTLNKPRIFTEEETRKYWNEGYLPEQACSMLDKPTPEHLRALGLVK